jgi:hypothetical protein
VWATAKELPPMHSNAREIGVGFLAADQYVIPFELAAIVLTVALVAAVYIARRKREDLVPFEGSPAAAALGFTSSNSGARDDQASSGTTSGHGGGH